MIIELNGGDLICRDAFENHYFTCDCCEEVEHQDHEIDVIVEIIANIVKPATMTEFAIVMIVTLAYDENDDCECEW